MGGELIGKLWPRNDEERTAALAAGPRPLAGPAGGALPEPGTRLDGQSLVLTVANLPVALRGQPLVW